MSSEPVTAEVCYTYSLLDSLIKPLVHPEHPVTIYLGRRRNSNNEIEYHATLNSHHHLAKIKVKNLVSIQTGRSRGEVLLKLLEEVENIAGEVELEGDEEEEEGEGKDMVFKRDLPRSIRSKVQASRKRKRQSRREENTQ